MPRVSPVSQGICYRDDYCQPRHENRNDEINFVDGCFKGLGIAAFVLYIGKNIYNNRENIKNGAKSFWNWIRRTKSIENEPTNTIPDNQQKTENPMKTSLEKFLVPSQMYSNNQIVDSNNTTQQMEEENTNENNNNNDTNTNNNQSTQPTFQPINLHFTDQQIKQTNENGQTASETSQNKHNINIENDNSSGSDDNSSSHSSHYEDAENEERVNNSDFGNGSTNVIKQESLE